MTGNVSSFENALSLIGFSSIRESLVLFFVFGLVVMFFGGCFLDLTKDLPDTYTALITEPVAFKIFIGMGGLGLFMAFISAVLKGQAILQKPFITSWVLAMSRTGLVAGAIITGMFSGFALALFFLAKLVGNEVAQKLAPDFFVLFLEASMFLSILTVLHLYLLSPWGQVITKLNMWTGILSAFFCGVAVGTRLSGFDEKTLIELGFLSASLQLGCMAVHWSSGRQKATSEQVRQTAE